MKKICKKLCMLCGGILCAIMLCRNWKILAAVSISLPDEEYRDKEMMAMEDFGGYLEELCKEGRRAELDNHVISQRLTLEEAALLSESSPLLEHMGGYAERLPNINTVGICVLTADLDGDGLEDVVEYGPGESDTADMLAIYLQTEGGDYHLSYSQPYFCTKVEWTDIIEIVQYKEERYLLFRDRDYQSWITAYRLSGGIPQGKLELTFICSDVEAEILFCSEGYDSERLVDDSADLYHMSDGRHCDYICRVWDLRCGSGESVIEDDGKERIEELFSQKYRAEQAPYIEEYGEDQLYRINEWSLLEAYESDINNDGIMERYGKATEDLYFSERGIDARGLTGKIPFLTGKYYGHHEGRRGLWYYMEESGEEMDFLSMCGLDIWEGEMTPQIFWVEETEKGNITFIAYQDKDEFKQRVDGYLIRGSRYEKVLSVSYIPQIDFRITYEYREAGRDGNVGYIMYITEDKQSVECMWENGDKAVSLNENIKRILGEKMEERDLQREDIAMLCYQPIEATEDVFIADFMIFYYIEYGDGIWEEWHTDYFYLRMDMATEECSSLTYEEWEGLEKNGGRW